MKCEFQLRPGIGKERSGTAGFTMGEIVASTEDHFHFTGVDSRGKSVVSAYDVQVVIEVQSTPRLRKSSLCLVLSQLLAI